MKKQRFFVSVLAGLVTVVLMFVAAELTQAKGAVPLDLTLPMDRAVPVAPQAVTEIITAACTYQGRLVRNGTPVSDTCDFVFSLWGGASEQIGLTDSQPDIPVTDGYFSVLLNAGGNFGANPFNGEARYLQIDVNCAANPGAVVLNPRIPISPVPYALSLRPGAVISGSVSGAVIEVNNSLGGGSGVSGQATATTGSARGVYGESASTSGVGVYGSAAATSGSNAGVVGESDSSSGAGVAGYADASSGTNYGVHGTTNSPDGYGVYATNTATGGASDEPTAIYAEVNAADGFALYGLNNNGRGVAGEGNGRYGVGGFSDTSYGVFGKSTSGPGVMGEGVYTGTVGIALASAGATSGVYGKSESPSGAGGRFVDLSNSNPRDSAGVWAGSYWSDIIQGYELNADGSSLNLRFRVRYDGEVFSDGGYNCGKTSGCWVTDSPADFAEMLAATDDPEPGDVLAVNADGLLVPSTQAYQASVVGIYSTAPMYLGGGAHLDEEGYVPLAVVGIVPVKASAENGPIQPGDLLVASGTPGHAMAAGDSPSIGTVIGKALGGLDSGTGVIQILVTLQ